MNYVERNQGGSVRQSGHQRYDHAGRVIYFAYNIPTLPRTASRRYASIFDANTGNLNRLYLATGDHWHLQYHYDHLHRVNRRQLVGEVPWETRFAYRTRTGDDSSLQVQHMTHSIGSTDLRYEYRYDTIGQITWWRDPVSQLQHQYHYDEQNQLTRETILSATGNVVVHEFTYTYDTFGNIRSRVHWQGNTTRTTTLQYGNTQWRDLLTQINLNGAITNVNYDGNTGNPLNWHGGASLTWARGRQLQRLQRTGVDVTFSYDHAGIRTGKRVNRNGAITEHSFYTQNGTIVGETRRNPNGTVDRLEFVYDEAGRPLQLIFNGRIYNYVLNLQGDVQQIRRSTDGVVVATYLYNAWGQLLQSTGSMAESNPLRYRGYFYDVATGLYYLQSRFYDPVIGRFINADAKWVLGIEQGSLLQYNLFAYCLNNPVNGVDPDGYLVITGTLIIVGAISATSLLKGGTVVVCALVVCAIYLEVDRRNYNQSIANRGLAPNVVPNPSPQGASSSVAIRSVGMEMGVVATLAHSQARSILGPLIHAYSEHVKGARPSTIPTHQKGEARRGRDQGGEKGDNSRTPRTNSKRRNQQKRQNNTNRMTMTANNHTAILTALLQ